MKILIVLFLFSLGSCSGPSSNPKDVNVLKHKLRGEIHELVASDVDTLKLVIKPCNMTDIVQFIDAGMVSSAQIEKLVLLVDIDCDNRNVELAEVYNEAINKALSEKPNEFFSSYCLVSNKAIIDEIIANPISDNFLHEPSKFENLGSVCAGATNLLNAINKAYSKY